MQIINIVLQHVHLELLIKKISVYKQMKFVHLQNILFNTLQQEYNVQLNVLNHKQINKFIH